MRSLTVEEFGQLSMEAQIMLGNSNKEKVIPLSDSVCDLFYNAGATRSDAISALLLILVNALLPKDTGSETVDDQVSIDMFIRAANTLSELSEHARKLSNDLHSKPIGPIN